MLKLSLSEETARALLSYIEKNETKNGDEAYARESLRRQLAKHVYDLPDELT